MIVDDIYKKIEGLQDLVDQIQKSCSHPKDIAINISYNKPIGEDGKPYYNWQCGLCGHRMTTDASPKSIIPDNIIGN